MSEKVVLTQEQADAAERYKKDGHKMAEFVAHAHSFHGAYEPLKAIGIDDMARFLYEPNSYEVEPRFKSGDWIVNKNKQPFNVYSKPLAVEITSLVEDEGRARARFADDCCAVYFDEIRHATPEEIAEEKERRWWKKHGRKPWELREGDILEYLGDLYIVDCFDSEMVCLKSGIERKSNYAETFGFVEKHFKIVCLVESRLDVSE